MIQEELKELILKYCQGMSPTTQQENEINDKVFECGADPMEVIAFIEEAKRMKSKDQIEKERQEYEAKLEAARLKAAEDEKNAKVAADKALEAIAIAEAARLKAEEEKAKTKLKIHEHEIRKERSNTNIKIIISAVFVLIAILYFSIRMMTTKSVADIATEVAYNSVSQKSVRDVDVSTDDVPSDDPSVKINPSGDIKKQLEEYYDQVFDLADGFYKIKKYGMTGIADKTGKIIQKPKYDIIYGRNNSGLIKIERNKKIGYLNLKGVEIIPPIYTKIENESDGLFKVEKDGKFGFISAKNMEIVAECIYDHIFEKKDNKYKVVKDGKFGFLDNNGLIIEQLK